MLGMVKAEFRKLLTIRSTYLILLITVALEVLVFWFASAYNLSPDSAKLALSDPHRLATRALAAVSLVSLLYAGIITVLNITHEYRYNTIMYTLSASKSRSRVLLAKLIMLSMYSVMCGAVFATLAVFMSKWGFAAHHYTLVHQTYDVPGLVWRVLFASWGLSMLAAVIAFIVRNQVGAIATLLILPTTIENLLGLWLHNNSVYLPFSLILNVLLSDAPTANLSYPHAALIALAWIIGGGIVSWVLFLRRDAN
jgi:ABC-2 type transport system permease protein